MSAFLVSKKHIDALVSARNISQYSRPFEQKSDDELGRMLLAANYESLAARYHDTIDEKAIESYRHEPRTFPVVTLIKAAHCYAYQACEHEGWEMSDAKKYIDDLVSMLTHYLPGYDAAPWGID